MRFAMVNDITLGMWSIFGLFCLAVEQWCARKGVWTWIARTWTGWYDGGVTVAAPKATKTAARKRSR